MGASKVASPTTRNRRVSVFYTQLRICFEKLDEHKQGT